MSARLDTIRRRRAQSGYGRGLPAPPFTVGKAPASLFEIGWNLGDDSAVLVPFGELYALTHMIQRNETYRGEDKQGSDCFGVERACSKCRRLEEDELL
jgi:hypothetical protein